jgi:MoaA/NifB/PqqE/SkfB family radical SAM enzyme
MRYNVLYRGPLSSCNYGCAYCPFAKRDETHADLEGDRVALERFLQWIAAQSDCRFGILFTPWGEALIRRWYQEALCFLTHLPHVESASIQTNLSCGLDWVDRCARDRLALWATYHPSEAARAPFVAKVRSLHERGIRLSVGVVGLREHFDDIARLREEIPAQIYLWVNAYKRESGYYQDGETHFLTAVDPQFPTNNWHHASQEKACWAGESSFTVDGQGRIRRCHFVETPIGSIHDRAWRAGLRPRSCPNQTCGCYIGYVNLKPLEQSTIYGDGILARIPLAMIASD